MLLWLKYPFVVESDVAGEIVEVRGAAQGITAANRAADDAYQEYVLLGIRLTATIPVGLSYERVRVLLTGISTKASS